MQKILGFEQSVIQKGTDVIKRYYLSTSANQVVVSNGSNSYTLVVPTGYYTFTEFYEAVGREMVKVIPLVRMRIHTEYIEFQCSTIGWYFDRSSANTTINNYGWTPWFKLNPSLKNLCIERPDESMNATNGYAFLPETYVLYDNIISTGMTFQMIKPKVVYTLKENNETLVNKSELFASGEWNLSGVTTTIVNRLNSEYQSAKGLTASDTNAIPFKASSNKITSESFAPDLTLTLTADNHTANCMKKSGTQYILEIWSKDIEYGANTTTIEKDITYTVQYSTDNIVETYTIAKGKYKQTALISNIVTNINKRQVSAGKAAVVIQKTVNNRVQILCKDNTVPSIITTCSDPLFPIPNGTWRKFDFKYLQARCVKMPALATPLQYLSAIKNGVKTSLFKQMTNDTIETTTTHKIYFVNPTTLAKVTPSFVGNTNFIYYANSTNASKRFEFHRYFRTKTISANTQLVYKNSSNQSKKITLQSGNLTQEEFIQDMNTKFAANGIPLEWIYSANGYTIKTDDPFTLTCTLLNDSFFGPSNPISGSISHIWTIPFNQTIQLDNTDCLYSDNPVDITNNLSTLKLYCNIVKSRTKPLLSNITIEDLHKNYFYKNRLVIPCMEQLDRLEYEFRNENDEELSFLGNIYLLITFTIQE